MLYLHCDLYCPKLKNCKCDILSDFQTLCKGYVHYGLLFTIPLTFSLTCPIISIVGFFCLESKHYADRHNLFYLYNVPPYIGTQRIPTLMTRLILTPAILQQVFMLVFTYFTGHVWIVFVSIFLLSASFFLIGKFSSQN